MILDGGMRTVLNSLGLNENDAWLAPVLLDQTIIRESVRKAHEQFLESGVDILTTNTYILSKRTVQPGATVESQKFDVTQVTIENISLAKETIDYFNAKNERQGLVKQRPLLAMSLSSFSTSIIGRAETANREHLLGDDDLRSQGYGCGGPIISSYFHSRLTDDILHHAAKSLVSVLAIETVGNLLDVQIICDVLKQKAEMLSKCSISSWVTLACLSAETVDTGNSVDSCIDLLAKCTQVTGVGINCTEPRLTKIRSFAHNLTRNDLPLILSDMSNSK